MSQPTARSRSDEWSTNAAEPAEAQVCQFKVGGMSCSFCAASITKAMERVDGVSEAKVSLAYEETLIKYDPAKVSPAHLKDILLDLGYTVRDPRKVRTFEEEETELRNERNNLLLAAGFSAAAVSLMVLMRLGLLPSQALAIGLWLMPTLALSTIFGPGWNILSMAWASLRRGILNQHVLLEFGAFAGLVGGFLGYISADFPIPDFFAVAVFITTYHLLSGYVSLLVRTRSSQAVRKLLALVPPTARVVRDGREEEVEIDEVRPGDLVRIRPGEAVPVDGQVVRGASSVDQSLVTGEPIPEEKVPGQEVIGGSINQTGTLLVQVTKVGTESFLQQIARQIEEARALKPGLLALVDRVLEVYVPGVLGFAGLALIVWTFGAWLVTGSLDWTRAVFAGLAVLVMGYPCALGMATPLAMIRGGGMAAQRGILMRSAEAFQVFKDVRKILLDKTGTITLGKPEVAEVLPAAGFAPSDVLRLAAAAESPSEHPLARAVLAAAESAHLEIPAADRFSAEPGRGVEAAVENRDIVVGSPRHVESLGAKLDDLHKQVRKCQSAGYTVLVVTIDAEVAGLVAVGDPLKPDARQTIERLRAAGLEPVMLTGDNERTARTVASAAGISEYRADLLPQDKVAVAQDLQSRGYRVAMVGDGINDAPALTQADIGIAIGAGTDIAIESADVVLIGERLSAVEDAYHISEASYKKTVQNLALAFSFNGIGVPLAVTGIVHPIWAMTAMVASVSAVLLNSFAGRLLPKVHPGRLAQLTLRIENMHCSQCLDSIKEAVSRLKGVDEVSGDPSRQMVIVTYREGAAEPDGIREAIIERGFRIAA